MEISIDAFSRHRVGVRRVLLSMACATMISLAGAQAATPSASSIDTIMLERNGFGAPSGTVLVLRRGGSATLSRAGSERSGGGESIDKGKLRHQDFEALARLVVAGGFFALDDTYQDPQLRDGSWATVTVSAGSAKKVVFSREDAGPESLKAIEAAIEGVQAKITFTPANR